MCGISGVVSKNNISNHDIDTINSMSTIIKHRGPDNKGNYLDENVYLSMRRLSIIDVEGGNQPFFNHDQSLVLIANGEIYNHLELRKILQSKGYLFKSNNDCETILHLYDEFGLDFIRYIRGMFAFALWDRKKKDLILARDRMGEKPLYIYENKNGFYFASEMKAILKSGVTSFELNPYAINQYFHYAFVPEPLTPIKNIKKLPAGHMMIYNAERKDITDHKYWNILDIEPIPGDPVKIIRDTLEEMICNVIQSEVQVGVSLSGGLDSSIIAALVKKHTNQDILAFTVGYPREPQNDERSFAKKFSNKLKIPFHEIEINVNEMVSFFPDLVFKRDDPIADIAGHNYYAVMKYAKQNGVDVMLQGQGADELFWGYPWMVNALDRSKIFQIFHQKKFTSLKKLLVYFTKGKSFNLLDKRNLVILLDTIIDYAKMFDRNKELLFFYDLLPGFKEAKNFKKTIYGKTMHFDNSQKGEYSPFTVSRPWKNLDTLITSLTCNTYLLENGIAQGDRLSMASSVELRLPFVDHILVEKIIGLRKNISDSKMPSKNWLKLAVGDLLPSQIINMPKRGFAPPASDWIENLFKKYGKNMKKGFLVQNGILSEKGSEILSKNTPYSGTIHSISFKALVLEYWCRQMLI